MAWINKPEKKKRNSFERKETDMRQLRKKAYNTTEWRKLREVYMREHPICEKCLEKGKITPAEDIHHKISPFRGGEVNYGLLLDHDNLMAVCKECHAAIHNKQQGHVSAEEIIRVLDELFDELYKDE